MTEDALLRAGCFLAVLTGVLCWEWRRPARPTADTRGRRWLLHATLHGVNAGVRQGMVPVAALVAASLAAQAGHGLLAGLDLPVWLVFALSLLLLDLAIYAQHVATHRVPWLWHLHRLHHADRHLDATTALRFHPLEIVLSVLWKVSVVTLLGAPPGAVLIHEILVNAAALFNHANRRLPPRMETGLRWLVVTPDVHRIHHSRRREETDSNYGNVLTLWDRLFGTWRAQPRGGQAGLVIGL